VTDKLQWKKKRWIRDKMYGGDHKKADHVCSEIAKTGGEMLDKFFPKDLDEAYYLIEVEQSFTRKNTTSEEVSGKVEATLDKEEASEIFKTGGVLGPDQAPRIYGLTEEANLKFLSAVESRSSGLTLTKNEAAIARRKEQLQAQAELKKKEEEEKKKKEAEIVAQAVQSNPKLAAEAKRAELKAKIKEKGESFLTSSQTSHSYFLKLKRHELSDKMLDQFQTHTRVMEQLPARLVYAQGAMQIIALPHRQQACCTYTSIHTYIYTYAHTRIYIGIYVYGHIYIYRERYRYIICIHICCIRNEATCTYLY